MTQEERELLLKDLSARLPYGVKGRYCLYDSKGNLTDWGNESEIVENIDFKECKIWTDDTVQGYHFDEFKPYLRPMSSMTEKEKKAFDEFVCIDEFAWNGDTEKGYPNQAIIMSDGIDWLLSHHFDYRGLIEKGLALEAPEGMYIMNN